VKRVLAGIGAASIAVWIAAYMLNGPPVIRVENHSGREIRSIEVSGTGFNKRIARLGPGESACVRPSGIPGESGLEFRADTDAGRIETTDLAYLEASGGYHVRIEISPDLTVRTCSGSASMAFCGLFTTAAAGGTCVWQ
jgi:hypothetical protein